MTSAATEPPEPAVGANRDGLPSDGASGDGVPSDGASGVGASGDGAAPGPGASGEAERAPADAARQRLSLPMLAVGGALIAGDRLRDGVRNVTGRGAWTLLDLIEKTRDRTERTRAMLTDAVDDAERRGRDSVTARRHDATALVNTTVDDAMSWARVKVMPRFIDDLVPHLISDVVPRLIDGALPDIRDRIVPVIIGDLSKDARVHELILAQSRGVLGQLADELRANTARGDDRLEAAARRVVGRAGRAATDRPARPEEVDEIRGA